MCHENTAEAEVSYGVRITGANAVTSGVSSVKFQSLLSVKRLCEKTLIVNVSFFIIENSNSRDT